MKPEESTFGVLQSYLRMESLRKTDEAWIVVDKDDWTEGQLRELLQWAKKSENHGFALSNPNFEYWLLLHDILAGFN